MKEVYRVIDRGDYGKLTNIITLRYIFNSTACGVCNSHYILHFCDRMSKRWKGIGSGT